MNSDARIDAIFNDALELPESQREGFLRQACGGDERLRIQVDRLLAAHGRLGSFLVPPAPPEAHPDSISEPTVALPGAVGGLSLRAGQVLGDRYRVEEHLGEGGMGDVWRAFDLKLRVDVALKAVRQEIFSTEQGHELLRREVRSARGVISANVCRIFDLVMEAGRELVSMEYVDGRTLHALIDEEAPLELREAGEIAAQLLAGLESIHESGLVHRDMKPDNVMVTRAGRVVVMDFGLAKAAADEHHTIAGTPAYMAPEQLRGDAVDARADIFSVGVILAEMLSQARDLEDRRELWRGLRQDPPVVPDGPWSAVIRKAVSWFPDDRYPTVRAMSRALEDVTFRAAGVDDRSPYPGMSAFTEEDAEYFFGREAEVEALGKKLQRMSMLAVVGPSGIGKSSFLRAGVLPALPEDWAAMVCTPGEAPFQAFALALAPELAGDERALPQLLQLTDPGVAVDVTRRWRQRHEHTLIGIDQFEELFTLNPVETQTAFTELLNRLVVDADVRVLVAMRDDFLFQAHEFPALRPIFSELTLLDSLSGASLRRALVQPALACGYRFEDEVLVDQMVKEVHEEKGALPLLAFAAARMWERRDRATGTLTRQAYKDIGGVAGALAQHAETTLGGLGVEREPIVRELFRNLVTGQGTRAVPNVADLLSVFENPNEAEEVLRKLIDARLLTSFEVPGTEECERGPEHRVEIIHESLLKAWPRLVRWQTQDADGAVLRDQVRQAAQLWEERSQSEDLLWTGTAYREFELWREHYSGGLSDREERFANAMTSRFQRQRTRRRQLVSGTLTLMALVTIVVFGLWQSSRLEARRAEGRNLLRFAEANLEANASKSFAYALASLELADDPQTREFALRTLQTSPIAIRLPGGSDVDPTSIGSGYVDWSPSGTQIAVGLFTGEFELWTDQGERSSILQGVHEIDLLKPSFDPTGSTIISTEARGRYVGFWSAEDGELLWSRSFPDFTYPLEPTAGQVITRTRESGTKTRWRSISLLDGSETDLGLSDGFVRSQPNRLALDSSGRWLASASAESVFVQSLREAGFGDRLLVGVQAAPVMATTFHPNGQYLASSDANGRVYLWSLESDTSELVRTLNARPGDSLGWLRFNPNGSWLAAGVPGVGVAEGRAWLWDLNGPPGALPIELGQGAMGGGGVFNAVFHPDRPWIATASPGGVAFWYFGHPPGYVFRTPDETTPDMRDVVFSSDGKWILAAHGRGTGVWRWALTDDAGFPAVQNFRKNEPTSPYVIALDPNGKFAAIAGQDAANLVDLETGDVRELDGFIGGMWSIAVSPDGRKVAGGGGFYRGAAERHIRVWDLETGGVRILDAGAEAFGNRTGMFFLAEDELLVTGGPRQSPKGIRIWSLRDGSYRSIWNESVYRADLSPDGRTLLCIDWPYNDKTIGTLMVLDMETREVRELPGYGEVSSVDFAPDGRFVAGGAEGRVYVGDLEGNPPHLLLGHDRVVHNVDVSPDGKWIASASEDGTVRLWPMPTGDPLHELPYGELMKRLRSITNLRVLEDPGSPTGYRLGIDGFEGWAEPPSW